jgi:hypothetical protein
MADIESIAWLADRPDWDGDLMTREALESAVQDFTNLPLTFNFDPGTVIGRVTSARMDGDALRIAADLTEPAVLVALREKHLAVRPTIMIEECSNQDGIHTINKLRLLGLSVVPAENSPLPWTAEDEAQADESC